MDNPLGPTLANWFLGLIEKKIFDQHLLFYPSFYVRYVDNVFAIFDSSTEVQLFLDVLNKQHLTFISHVRRLQAPQYHFLMLN